MPKTARRPLFTPKQIDTYRKYMRKKVALVFKLQDQGKLPYCKKIPKITINVKDIRRCTGLGERQAQRHMKAMREALKKKKHQFISVEEFIDYSGLPPLEVRQALNLIPERGLPDDDE